MEYKRFTKIDDGNGTFFVEGCESCYHNECRYFDCIVKAIDLLAELEDKIEQGTLIDTDKWFIEKEDNHGKVRYLICKYDKWLTISDFCSTREEAEKRLKELQNG